MTEEQVRKKSFAWIPFFPPIQNTVKEDEKNSENALYFLSKLKRAINRQSLIRSNKGAMETSQTDMVCAQSMTASLCSG